MIDIPHVKTLTKMTMATRGELDVVGLLNVAVQLTRAQIHGETVGQEFVQRNFTMNLDFLCKLNLEIIKETIGEAQYKELLDQTL